MSVKNCLISAQWSYINLPTKKAAPRAITIGSKVDITPIRLAIPPDKKDMTPPACVILAESPAIFIAKPPTPWVSLEKTTTTGPTAAANNPIFIMNSFCPCERLENHFVKPFNFSITSFIIGPSAF